MAAPTVKFAQFLTSSDPSGSRHLTTHPSYVKELTTNSAGTLDFGNVSVDSKSTSGTKLLLFRASSMGTASAISNMRFWSSTVPTIQGSRSFNMSITTTYTLNNTIDDTASSVPIALPGSQNLLRTGGSATITGTGDTDVSQWIYLSFTASTNVPTGRYGGSGGLVFRVTYDYT